MGVGDHYLAECWNGSIVGCLGYGVWLVFVLLSIVDGNSHSLFPSMFAFKGLVVLAWFQAVDSIGHAVGGSKWHCSYSVITACL